MGLNSITPAMNMVENRYRGPSAALWRGNRPCPWDDFKSDMGKGMTFEDDFVMAGNATMSSAYAGSIGQWSVYGYAGAQVNDAQLEGGVIKIGSDGDNEGVALQSAAGSFRLVTTSTLALNGALWFETAVGIDTVAATKGDMFVGLASPVLSSGLPGTAYPITTTDNTLATTGDFIGFHRKGNAPTDWFFTFCLTSGTVNYPTGLTTLIVTSGATAMAASVPMKLGFLFDPFAATGLVSTATARQTAGSVRRKLIRVFVNGLELPTFLSTEDVQNATAAQAFPTAFMMPMLAIMNQTGSTPPNMLVDWIRVAQAGNS